MYLQAILTAAIGGLIGSSPKHCNQDSCLEVLQNSLKIASDACSTYGATIITPPPVTVTEHSTITKSKDEYTFVTETETFYNTATKIVKETATTVIPASTVTVTSYDPDLPNLRSFATVLKLKGDPPIPTFAGPCTDATQFTSACSCIGVTPEKEIIAPVATATVTKFKTTTYTRTLLVTDRRLHTITEETVSSTKTVATETITGAVVTTTLSLPYPELCQNIRLYSNIRAGRDRNVNGIPSGKGKISIQDCCLECFLTPDCIAFVVLSDECLVVFNEPLLPELNPASPRCPNGVGDTRFMQYNIDEKGYIGKGPCHGIWVWN